MTLTIEEIKSLPEDMQLQYASWGVYSTASVRNPTKNLQEYVQIQRSEGAPPSFVIEIRRSSLLLNSVDLRGVRLIGQMRHSELGCADLTGAQMDGFDLKGSDLRDAKGLLSGWTPKPNAPLAPNSILVDSKTKLPWEILERLKPFVPLYNNPDFLKIVQHKVTYSHFKAVAVDDLLTLDVSSNYDDFKNWCSSIADQIEAYEAASLIPDLRDNKQRG